ncbi:flagellin [Methylobacterium sp. WL120]|uniref:flagellin N-terminal helical domain-containing protein n=1 Tax=Methylobacterium sp. WL120 TaxID=2603887 RepID=UPI0011C88C1D|nr:flagellin [Methylobacterium sp. WL120]TXM64665.1 flagellar protein [Methylobacterium sp. WL120]
MADVTLQSNIRSNLVALQNTAALLSTSQDRLATGKKVNSALDNPLSFSVSQNLTDRSQNLTSLLDGMSNGVQTIQAANKGADSIINNLKAIQGIIAQAKSASGASSTSVTGSTATLTAGSAFVGTGKSLQISNTTDHSVTNIDIDSATSVQGVIDAVNNGTGGNYTASLEGGNLKISASTAKTGQTFTAGVVTTTGGAADTTKTTALFGNVGGAPLGSQISNAVSQTTLNSYAKQINNLMDSISQTASDSGYNGTNLLKSTSTLNVSFNKDATSSQSVSGQDLSISGFLLSKTANVNSATLADVTSTIEDKVGAAIDTARAFQGSLSTSLSIIQTRQDFSKNLVNILDTGSANLVNADTNLEAANVLALQTRQSLSQSALSLANQANQGVLQLLR